MRHHHQGFKGRVIRAWDSSGPLIRQPMLWAALALGLVGLLPGRVWAEPKAIGVRKMLDGCEVVAVARFTGPWDPRHGDRSVELELTRVLKGNVPPGKHLVCFTDIPRVAGDTSEFVAFLGPGLCWRFAAIPLSPDQGVADGVLRVRGFYDWNGYFVTPGLVTLTQIETFLKDRTLAYVVRGPLYFPRRGQPGWEASPLQIEVNYDAMTGRAEVRGLPELQGFPTRPRVSVGSPFADGGIHLTYCRDNVTPLEIQGQVRSRDPADGAMLAKFFVTRPAVPRQADFEGYAGDPFRGQSYYAVMVACAPFGGEGKPRMLTLTDEKMPGYMPKLEGWSDATLDLDRISVDTKEGRETAVMTVKLNSGEELVLEFDLGATPDGPDEFRWTFREYLLYPLLAGDLPGRVLIRGGGAEREVTTFTASLGEVGYSKLERPRAVEAEFGTAEVEVDGADGLESFRCDDCPMGFWWEGWTPWLVAGALAAAGACVVWRLWRRRPGTTPPT